MRFIPSPIFYYLVSRVDLKKPNITGNKYKPDIAIACKDVVKSWAKRIMKNNNRLQIEIWGFKELLDTLGYPSCSWFIEIPILNYVRYEGTECDTALMNNGSNGDEDIS